MIKLKTISFLIIFAFLATFGDGFTQASKTNSTETSTTKTTTKKTTAKKYGYFELTPAGGVIFRLDHLLITSMSAPELVQILIIE